MRDLAVHSSTENAGGIPGELLIWLSPAFPVGGFAYSQGLETAAARGWVDDARSLDNWLRDVIAHGALRNDLIVIASIMSASSDGEVKQIAELSSALQPSAERAREALDQGRSFMAAYDAGWKNSAPLVVWPENATFPVAFAVAARTHCFATAPALEAYAIAFCTNLLSAAIRLGLIGQFGCQELLARLLPSIRATVATIERSSLDDLGTATFGADLASMLHETQETRLFRS